MRLLPGCLTEDVTGNGRLAVDDGTEHESLSQFSAPLSQATLQSPQLPAVELARVGATQRVEKLEASLIRIRIPQPAQFG